MGASRRKRCSAKDGRSARFTWLFRYRDRERQASRIPYRDLARRFNSTVNLPARSIPSRKLIGTDSAPFGMSWLTFAPKDLASVGLAVLVEDAQIDHDVRLFLVALLSPEPDREEVDPQ